MINLCELSSASCDTDVTQIMFTRNFLTGEIGGFHFFFVANNAV